MGATGVLGAALLLVVLGALVAGPLPGAVVLAQAGDAEAGGADDAASRRNLSVGWDLAWAPFGGLSANVRLAGPWYVRPSFFVNVSPDSMDGQAALRLIYDLGKRGPVYRYAGVGAGAWFQQQSYDPVAPPFTQSGVAGSLFLGIDLPFTWWALTAPFSVNLEATVLGGQLIDGTLLKTTVQSGFTYWF